MLLNRVITFLIFLALSTTFHHSVGRANAQMPVTVYSGTVHNDRSDEDIRFRIFFLQQSRAGQPALSTAAFGVLYFGEEGTHEYASLYYDVANIHESRREIMLYRNDDARSRRLPTLTLQFSDDDTHLTGTMVSQTESLVGAVSLHSGWDFGPGNFMPGISGIYDASKCSRNDGAAMHFEQIELIPSRMHQEKLVPEGMFGETNYIGNGLCKRLGYVNCLSFNSGSWNFVQGRLDLHQGSAEWTCNRSSESELICASRMTGQCTIKKTHETLALPVTSLREHPVSRFKWRTDGNPDPKKSCATWQGDFRGNLLHRLDSREQAIHIRLNSFLAGSNEKGERCILTGSAKLHFAIDGNRTSTLNFPIINVEMQAGAESMVLHTDAYTDLALEISIDEAGNLNGNWYSRLFGLVGELNAHRETRLAPAPQKNHIVYSFEGLFTNLQKPLYQMDLRTIEAGFDKSSHDPFVGLKIQGNLFFGGGLPDSDGVVTWDSYTSSSYDYFTNFLVIKGSGTHSGYVDESGLHLRASSNKYLSIVTHPLDLQVDWDRWVTPPVR